MEKNNTDGRPIEQVPEAAQRRRGSRRSAGADTPAGMNTDRTVTPAKRETDRLESEGEDTKPAAGTNP